MDGDRFFNGGFVSFTYTRGQTHRDMITNLVTQATIPSQIGSISENLGNQKLTRGKVVCGLAKDYLRQIALAQNASFYIEDDKVNMIRLDDIPTEAIELAPQSGLIGAPAQTSYGISFKCLLNPKIKPNTFVHIDNKLVREQKFTPTFQQPKPGTKPQTQVIRQLDGDGLYRVISVNHIGDTRGEEWFTECICISQAGLIPSLVSDATMNAF